MGTLLDAMRQYVGNPSSTATKNAVTAAALALGTQATQKADYSLSPNPTVALDKLAAALDSQRFLIFR
jgi:hypothetical protein